MSDWISTKDKLPSSHGEYVVYTGNFSNIAVCYYQDGKWIECGTAPIEANRPYEDWTTYVTHWMDVEPPK